MSTEYIELQNKKTLARLTSDQIFGFTKTFLLDGFDAPQPTPGFHLTLWDYFCSTSPYVAVAAPRGHAKSTAGTHTYTVANLAFKLRDYALITAQTETQAAQFVSDIKNEFIENERIIRTFQIGDLIKDTESDFIVEFKDRKKFRVVARGSGQSVRGIKWRGKRPNLIVGDDLENDEIVLNEDRRLKFKNWVFNALLPCGSDYCDYRFVGTILHMDSFLNSLMPDPDMDTTVNEPLYTYSTDTNRAWHSILFRAHPSLQDFSEILWPDKFSEERLRRIRQMYIDQGNAEGYSQEYLNEPLDLEHAMFRKEDFKPIPQIQFTDSKNRDPEQVYACIDMAISEKKHSADTVIGVATLGRSGMLRNRDVIKGKWDSHTIMENMFRVQEKYNPELFFVEEENIAKALGPILYSEMGVNGNPYINLDFVTPVQDKIMRARALQARMRAGKVEWDFEADWYLEALRQLTQFPRGRKKDIVDVFSWIALKLNEMVPPDSFEQQDRYEYEQERYDTLYYFDNAYRDNVTGY